MNSSSRDVLDEARLEQLYRKLERPMYNVVYRWLWSSEDAHDVVQEAFAKLWQMRDRVDMATAEPLVYRIAINQASNLRRWKRLRSFVRLDNTTELSDADAESPEQRDKRARVRRAIEALPDKLMKVVALCDLAGLSYKEVAAVLDIVEGTVGSRRNKALAILRDELGEWETDGDEAARA